MGHCLLLSVTAKSCHEYVFDGLWHGLLMVRDVLLDPKSCTQTLVPTSTILTKQAWFSTRCKKESCTGGGPQLLEPNNPEDARFFMQLKTIFITHLNMGYCHPPLHHSLGWCGFNLATDIACSSVRDPV